MFALTQAKYRPRCWFVGGSGLERLLRAQVGTELPAATEDAMKAG